MREALSVGDLVKDKLNKGDGAYGMGLVVGVAEEEEDTMFHPELEPIRYRVYFTKFQRIITFHAEYLEKV
jgi:hypothetical protein